MPRHAWARALSHKINKWSGRWPLLELYLDLTILDVRWPQFIFSMDHFLYWFSTFREKMKKFHRLEVWIFCKMHHRIPFLLALRAPLRQCQVILKGLNFVKTLVKSRIIYAKDPLLQNMTKIVCLCWLTFDILNYKPRWTVLNYMGQFFKISIVYRTLYLWNEDGDPHYFCISGTSNSSSASRKNLKIFYRLENFRANVLKESLWGGSTQFSCALLLTQFSPRTSIP